MDQLFLQQKQIQTIETSLEDKKGRSNDELYSFIPCALV